jgi:hypothetical protein
MKKMTPTDANDAPVPIPATGTTAFNELLDRIFRDPSTKQGLKFFTKGERGKLKLRTVEGNKIEIFCAKREK